MTESKPLEETKDTKETPKEFALNGGAISMSFIDFRPVDLS